MLIKGKLSLINSLLKNIKLELKKFDLNNNENLRRNAFIINNKIDLVIDVGANVGQYALDLRKGGYTNRICSFEPLNKAFKTLKSRAEKDNKWEVYNLALGEIAKTDVINISYNSHSSSILEMLDLHKKSQPNATYFDTQIIQIETLDNLFQDLSKSSSNIYLKIDTQGYESFVLNGALNSLKFIRFIQLEMSLKPLYNEQLLFEDLYFLLKKNNFELVSIERGFTDSKTGELLQLDGLFTKKTL